MPYFGSAVLLDEAAGPTLRVRLRETGFTVTSTRCLKVTGGCLSLTLVEPSVATPGPCEG